MTAGLTDYSGATGTIGDVYHFTAKVAVNSDQLIDQVTWYCEIWTCKGVKNKPQWDAPPLDGSAQPVFKGADPNPPPVGQAPCAYVWQLTFPFYAVQGPTEKSHGWKGGPYPYCWPGCQSKMGPPPWGITLYWWAEYDVGPEHCSTEAASYVVSYQQ